jgi:S-adenosylmethionine hydrolase
VFEFTVRGLSTAVLYVDGFGDVKLAGGAADLLAAVGAAPDRLELALRNRRLEVPWSATFGDVSIGAPLLFDDEDGRTAWPATRSTPAGSSSSGPTTAC